MDINDIKGLIRPSILNLAPYSTARDEYSGGEIGLFLDANESPYDNEGLNRYPDPHHADMRSKLSEIKGVAAESIFIGNGSDEAIDIVFRVFCTPSKDNIVAIAPSYGMYKVCGEVNDIEVREVELEEGFRLDSQKLLAATDKNSKVIFLCSPNNPSGNLLSRDEVEKVLEGFKGIVVVDEAYVDFCTDYTSFNQELGRYPNLIVLQTLSKAWGLAGVRLGMAFASEFIVSVMNKVKYPYNINQLTQQRVITELDKASQIAENCKEIIAEREKLMEALQDISYVEKIYPSDANFVLVKVGDANALYNHLVENGVIVRNRNSVVGCSGCLRISIGTPEENTQLISLLKNYKKA